MFKTLFQSLKKSRRLQRISQKLSKPLISDDWLRQTFEELRKSNIESENLEFWKEEFVGRTLARPVYKDRTAGFVDVEMGKIITPEEIRELRETTTGAVTEDEFRILREEMLPEGTVLTMEIIEDIIKTGYSFVDLYKTEPSLNDTEKGAVDELIDLAESDEYVRIVMDEYGANRQTLKELYNRLVLVGAGQYAKGHYVAASSLVYPLTLKFLLEHFDGKKFSINNWDDNNSAMYIANRLIDYFKKNKVGEVK